MKDRTIPIRTTIRELWSGLSPDDQARYLRRFTPRQIEELGSITGGNGTAPQTQAERAQASGVPYQKIQKVDQQIRRALKIPTRRAISEIWSDLSLEEQQQFLKSISERQRTELGFIVGLDGMLPQTQAERAQASGIPYQNIHTIEVAIHRALTTDPKQTPTRRAISETWQTLSQTEQQQFLKALNQRQRTEFELIIAQEIPQTLAERAEETGQTIAAQANLEQRLLRRLKGRDKPRRESKPPVQIDSLQQLITDQHPAPEALRAIAMAFPPKKQQIALLLLDGKSVKEIMDKMGITGSFVRTVRTNIVDAYQGTTKPRRSIPKPRSTSEKTQRQPEVVVFAPVEQIISDEPKEKSEPEMFIDLINSSFVHAKQITHDYFMRNGQLPSIDKFPEEPNSVRMLIGQLWLLGFTNFGLQDATDNHEVHTSLNQGTKLAINKFPDGNDIGSIAGVTFTGAETSVLWMMHELGMPINDAAHYFAIPPMTIRQHYRNALAKLDTVLSKNTV